VSPRSLLSRGGTPPSDTRKAPIVDHVLIVVVGLAVAILWRFAGFRWMAKAGLTALTVLALVVIVAYPDVLAFGPQ